jgi:hypothetical protein
VRARDRTATNEHALTRLESDGLLVRHTYGHRATRRWQGAMARAAFKLLRAGDDGTDLRLPIATALLELYGESLSDLELATMVEVLLPIEAAELDPREHLARAAGIAAK